MPELLAPKAIGSLPALSLSSFQNSFCCASSSVAKSCAGLYKGPASSATTDRPARASRAINGAPPAPVPITSASTGSSSAYLRMADVKAASVILIQQQPWLASFQLIQTNQLPAWRIRHTGVTDAFLHQRVGITNLCRQCQQFFKKQCC